MKAALLALTLAIAPAFAADLSSLADIKPGQYELKISGLLCWACARAIAAQLSKVSSVEKAAPDFANQSIDLTVKQHKTLSPWQIRRALSRAESQVNLGGHYEVTDVRYKIMPIVPLVPDSAPAPASKKQSPP